MSTITLDPDNNTIVGNSNGLTGNGVLEDVHIRLSGFGIEATEDDDVILELLIGKINESVLNFTNLKVVPEGLHYKIVDAVCGEFLQTKYSLGQLTLEVVAPVTSIKEGDTTVSYATTATSVSPQKVFTDVLKNMALSSVEMSRYRVFVW